MKLQNVTIELEVSGAIAVLVDALVETGLYGATREDAVVLLLRDQVLHLVAGGAIDIERMRDA